MNSSIPVDSSVNITGESIIDPIVVSETVESTGSSYLIYIIAIVVLIMSLIVIFKRKTKTAKKEIGIIGERGSGKTQLFIGLSGGKSLETVPSIVNNICQLDLGVNKYQLCDFMGDNLSKEQVINQIARFHTIVHVIDGTDSKKLGDAALFIYRILANKQFQKDPCNYIIFLNKSDLKTFHGLQKLVKRIEDEIETIKVTRRNLTEENQQGEQDYIRNERIRFDFKKQGITIIVGSSRQNRNSLATSLDDLCS